MSSEPLFFLENLIERYPVLAECRDDILAVYHTLVEIYENGGKLLLAGNGGSASDADHIAGELLKGFLSKRELSREEKQKLLEIDAEKGEALAGCLQGALPAIALSQLSAINTAVINDIDGQFIYAQQLQGLATSLDAVLLISTSGNARNLLYAAVVARSKGARIIGLTGQSGGELWGRCDVHIRVPETETYKIQELHLPIYHALCMMLEAHFFPAEKD